MKFGKTMEELDVIDEYGRINTEELLDMRIVGTLRKGKDGLLYVNRICSDEDYYIKSLSETEILKVKKL